MGPILYMTVYGRDGNVPAAPDVLATAAFINSPSAAGVESVPTAHTNVNVGSVAIWPRAYFI